MPALRTRLILSILVFVLVAGACGGDNNTDPADRASEATPQTFTTSESASEGSPEPDTTVNGQWDLPGGGQ